MLFVSSCSDEFEEVLLVSSDNSEISVSNKSVYLSVLGSEYTATAELVNTSGVAYEIQPALNWISASSTIVSVDNKGLITANGFGSTIITVSTSDISTQITVVVNDAVITLNGTARYEDREYNGSGFITQQDYFKAVRHAKVTVVDSEGNPVGGLDTVYTDADGKFSLTGFLTSQHYVYLSATTNTALGLGLAVQDRTTALYSVSKQVDVQDLNNFMLDIPLSSEASGAFNILDVFTNSAQFMLQYTSATAVNLTAFWEVGNTDGTYYCSGFDSSFCDTGKGVYVYNETNADTDEYDDDVLYHEFAHFFLQTISRDDSYGGCHVLSSTDLDLRLAWSEGFGDFFPAAIKQWLADDAQRVGLLSTQISNVPAYIDTYQNTQQIYVALDTLNSTYVSAANELAIAKILHTLNLQFGMTAIMNVLTSYFPDVATPVNMESFWDGWLSVNAPSTSDKSVLQGLFNDRSIYYQEDSFEADNVINSTRKILLNVSETHYLYSDQLQTDVDYVGFDVVAGSQYTLSTANLTDGADTYLRVLKANGSALTVSGVEVENDDADENAYYGFDSLCGTSRVRNNKTALSSSISFTAPTTGTYYAELRTTTDADPYLSAGRYGTFTFKVIQN